MFVIIPCSLIHDEKFSIYCMQGVNSLKGEFESVSWPALRYESLPLKTVP